MSPRARLTTIAFRTVLLTVVAWVSAASFALAQGTPELNPTQEEFLASAVKDLIKQVGVREQLPNKKQSGVGIPGAIDAGLLRADPRTSLQAVADFGLIVQGIAQRAGGSVEIQLDRAEFGKQRFLYNKGPRAFLSVGGVDAQTRRSNDQEVNEPVPAPGGGTLVFQVVVGSDGLDGQFPMACGGDGFNGEDGGGVKISVTATASESGLQDLADEIAEVNRALRAGEITEQQAKHRLRDLNKASKSLLDSIDKNGSSGALLIAIGGKGGEGRSGNDQCAPGEEPEKFSGGVGGRGGDGGDAQVRLSAGLSAYYEAVTGIARTQSKKRFPRPPPTYVGTAIGGAGGDGGRGGDGDANRRTLDGEGGDGGDPGRARAEMGFSQGVGGVLIPSAASRSLCLTQAFAMALDGGDGGHGGNSFFDLGFPFIGGGVGGHGGKGGGQEGTSSGGNLAKAIAGVLAVCISSESGEGGDGGLGWMAPGNGGDGGDGIEVRSEQLFDQSLKFDGAFRAPKGFLRITLFASSFAGNGGHGGCGGEYKQGTAGNGGKGGNGGESRADFTNGVPKGDGESNAGNGGDGGVKGLLKTPGQDGKGGNKGVAFSASGGKKVDGVKGADGANQCG